MDNSKDEPLLSARDMAKALNVSTNTIRKWIRDKKLKAIDMGWFYRIPPSELERIRKEGVGK